MAKPTKPGGRRPRKRERKNVVHGVAHIKSSFNNTIVSIADHEGTPDLRRDRDQPGHPRA